MNAETYATLRAYMFGDSDPHKAYSKETLSNVDYFVEWVLNECDWRTDLPDYSEDEIRELAREVFANEVGA